MWHAAASFAEWAWWAFVAMCVVAPAVYGLWDRRPWRNRETFSQHHARLLAEARRSVEAEELASVEAQAQSEGGDIWRPDPARTRQTNISISARRRSERPPAR